MLGEQSFYRSFFWIFDNLSLFEFIFLIFDLTIFLQRTVLEYGIKQVCC